VTLRSIAAIILGISLPLLITSGLTAYIVSSWTLVLLRVLGATRFSPRLYWACGMFGNMRGTAMFGGRVVRALTLSVVIPFFYALIFEIIGNAELPVGAILGLGASAPQRPSSSCLLTRCTAPHSGTVMSLSRLDASRANPAISTHG
jgi:hypothetical protein